MKSSSIAAASKYSFKNKPDNRADTRAFNAGTFKADVHICHLGGVYLLVRLRAACHEFYTQAFMAC